MELIQQRNQPTRKRIRLEEYDYSEHGAYFVTLCTNDRKQLFWDVGADIIRPPKPKLSEIGKIVDRAICQISEHYSNVYVDKYCIMPEHIHMIVCIEKKENGRHDIRPYDFNGCGINETMGVKTGRKTDLAKVLCGSCDSR